MSNKELVLAELKRRIYISESLEAVDIDAATDIDDVLIGTTPAFRRYMSEKTGVDFTGDITAAELWEEHGIDPKWVTGRFKEFEELGYPGAEPVEGAQEEVERIHEAGRVLAALTGRDPSREAITNRMLKEHFSPIRGLVMVGNSFMSEVVIPKWVALKALGGRAIAEDTTVHALDCADNGIRVAHFGAYPWIGPSPPHHLITPTPTWPEVTPILLAA